VKRGVLKIVRDESYELAPHGDIIEVKKSLDELKIKIDKSSSTQLLDSMSYLTKSMDTMLKLFRDAAEETNIPEDNLVNEKLDKILEQNRIIADGMVAISGMVKDFTEKQKKQESILQHSFQPPRPEAGFPPTPEPNLQPSPDLPKGLDEPPIPQQMNQSKPQGPVAMPSMPFSSLEEPKKKKGLFGKFGK